MPKRRNFKNRAALLAPECRACGTSSGLELDHWDNDPTNNDPLNARTLCFACNATKAEFARDQPWVGTYYFLEWVKTVTQEIGKDGLRRLQDQANRTGQGRSPWSSYKEEMPVVPRVTEPKRPEPSSESWEIRANRSLTEVPKR